VRHGSCACADTCFCTLVAVSAHYIHILIQTRLKQDIQYKQTLREQVAQQLEGDMQRFKDMEREAAALISKARHANSKLMVS
jgi:thermostable 8-oxoguanine DNA glycosylase